MHCIVNSCKLLKSKAFIERQPILFICVLYKEYLSINKLAVS